MGSAVEPAHTVNFLDGYCGNKHVQHVWYDVAKRYPGLSELQNDVVRRVMSLPDYAAHPKIEQMKTICLSLVNTTQTKPFRPAGCSSGPVSAGRRASCLRTWRAPSSRRTPSTSWTATA